MHEQGQGLLYYIQCGEQISIRSGGEFHISGFQEEERRRSLSAYVISRCVFAIEVCIMENSETQLNQSGQVKTSLMVWLLFFVNMFTK